MVRVPPPSAGSVMAGVIGALARLGVGAFDAQVIDLGALDEGPHGRVGVDAEEDVGLMVVGERRPIVVRDDAVVFAREEHPQAEAAFDQRAQPARHRERDVLLERAARSLRAKFVATVTGIDDHGPQAGRGRGRHRRTDVHRQRRRRDGAGQLAGDWAGGRWSGARNWRRPARMTTDRRRSAPRSRSPRCCPHRARSRR